jgi:hypothetical protein
MQTEAHSNDPMVLPDVAKGANDHLFLVGGAQKVLEYVSGSIKVKDGIRRIFKDNLTARRAFCAAIGVPYLHIVCPDKHSVISGFPFPISTIVGNLFKEDCGDLFLFPATELQSEKAGETYWKTDTHWNELGKWIFVREATLGLGIDKQLVEAAHSTYLAERVPVLGYCGDLGSKLTPRQTEDGLLYKPATAALLFSNNIVGSNGAIHILINRAISAGKLLIFGDSFAIICLDIFSLFFREILLVRSPFFHTEIVTMFEPSHVLSANVERYLPSMPTDREAPSALIWPQLLKKESSPSDRFYESLNAILRPRSLVYERFMNELEGT